MNNEMKRGPRIDRCGVPDVELYTFDIFDRLFKFH